MKNLARLHLEEGSLQKAAQVLNQSVGMTQKIQAFEPEVEAYLERARYYTIIGELKSARYWVNAADTLIEKNDLHRMKPTVSIYISEMLMAEGKYI